MENNDISEEKAKKGPNQQVAGAILIAGLFIAGAILIKDSSPREPQAGLAKQEATTPVNLPPVNSSDRILGQNSAKVTIVEYADFQCPFCGKFYKEVKEGLISDYVEKGQVRFIYRDFAFLGQESINSALAARCANDQGKFWEYHNYLYTHQNGENQGAFNDENLKSFALTLGLDKKSFDQCFDSDKYVNEIAQEKQLGKGAGVKGTPKGFILVNDKVVETIDGAESASSVKAKIENALK